MCVMCINYKWMIWMTVNRLCTGVRRSRKNLKEWGISDGKEDITMYMERPR